MVVFRVVNGWSSILRRDNSDIHIVLMCLTNLNDYVVLDRVLSYPVRIILGAWEST